MGELVIGAYLKMERNCDLICYDVSIGDQGEIDVVGINFERKEFYMCEASTHLEGLNYGRGNQEIVPRIKKKFERATHFKDKLAKSIQDFQFIFMFWSPIVAENVIQDLRESMPYVDLVCNQTYSEKINELFANAKQTKSLSGEKFFRALQILAHMKGKPSLVI